ncbi:MAG: 4Fe-4S dicluster domain-containing protein [Eubacteriales bacterium]
MLVIQKTKIKEILDTLAKEYKVIVPAKDGDTSKFIPYGDNTEMLLEENVQLPPKDVFFPQTEKMYKFKSKKNTMEIENLPIEGGKQLIFGIRSCDMKSLDCLDQVFLTKGTDEFYKEKRDKTALIALSCTKPKETCFCTSMGLDPQKAVGADVQAYDLGDKIGFEAITEQGKKIIASIEGQLSEESVVVPKFGEFKINVDVEGVPEKLKGMFESPMWDDISRKCLNCGACTYVCPTCHCFDISQEVRGEDGVKYRCWDSCMFGEYTQMAGGHNPRPTKKERVRNRFMHKLNYFVERYNMLLCTGCGRCINVCPVNMDITAIIKQVKEAE